METRDGSHCKRYKWVTRGTARGIGPWPEFDPWRPGRTDDARAGALLPHRLRSRPPDPSREGRDPGGVPPDGGSVKRRCHHAKDEPRTAVACEGSSYCCRPRVSPAGPVVVRAGS
ncbi:hypothetical protein SHKM778_66280 [Streptomyces sp. KM77-8]|uniref:Uncharacterized protein n=1 Tax=Streptomyces haneummycinicus TaxID=3074435 RepID=A0AAT9HRW8_9ACTN